MPETIVRTLTMAVTYLDQVDQPRSEAFESYVRLWAGYLPFNNVHYIRTRDASPGEATLLADVDQWTPVGERRSTLLDQAALDEARDAVTRDELRRWQQYAAYCRSCALSGEINPQTFEEFCRHMEAHRA